MYYQQIGQKDERGEGIRSIDSVNECWVKYNETI